MSAERIEDIRIEQAGWSEGWRKSPIWLRLLGGPKQFYADTGRRQTYRMKWGELTWGWSGLALQLGGYETAHLHIALLFVSAFIRLPVLDKAICGGTNSIESPRYGFTTFGASVHLNWGHRVKIVDPFWQRRYLFREFLAHDGHWLPHDDQARTWAPGEGVEPHKIELPYHYLLSCGEVQHVTATVTRERSWTVWKWFGESTHPRALGHVARPRRAWLSDWLRQMQKRLNRPSDYIEVAFSDEVGERAGSWKGGCVGCSYEMKPGETPRHTLQRMQAERRFR